MTSTSYHLPPALIESVAGFLAGVSSTSVSHPLEVIKTRLQLQGKNKSPALGDSFQIAKNIFLQENAFRGFYRGLTPNVVGNSVSWALYFVCYDRIKRQLYNQRDVSRGDLPSYDYFLASGTAGTLTSLCTNPIWVIKTRMLSTSSRHPGAYSSIWDGTKQIYETEGIFGFYRGLVPSLFGVTHGALQFMAYEELKSWRARAILGKQEDLSSADYLALSSLAKMFAGITTYPYQVVRARLQMYDAGQIYSSARDVVRQVWKKEGFMGFYKGLGPNLLRVLPSTWVTFLVYEKTKLLLSRPAHDIRRKTE